MCPGGAREGAGERLESTRLAFGGRRGPKQKITAKPLEECAEFGETLAFLASFGDVADL